jgi:uncharacterized iron-regulated membrane protein
MGGNVNGSLRKIIFWLHLLAGLIAGVVILIMSVTGAALAFEKEIVAWADREARRVVPAPERLPLDELLAQVRSAGRPSGITLDADSNIALLVSFGRTNAAYVNPYTGAVRPQGAGGTRTFMQTMIEWHRYLGGHDERRAFGKAVTGACNAAFLFLAVSGLFLWCPRQWTANALRAIGLMSFKLRGKARDWNWHNAIGFWTAPVLIVLTATALPISYKWAGDFIYQLTGTTAPPQVPAVEVPAPQPGARQLSMGARFEIAQNEVPQWKQISLRAGGPGGRGAGGSLRTNEVSRGESRAPQAVTLSVIEKGRWPLFATTQLSLDPFTGAVLRREGYADQNLGRRVRSWTRFLHTGEALGPVGKAVAGLASAAAALLVWTGFALAWRRFFPKRNGDVTVSVSQPVESAVQTAAKE